MISISNRIYLLILIWPMIVESAIFCTFTLKKISDRFLIDLLIVFCRIMNTDHIQHMNNYFLCSRWNYYSLSVWIQIWKWAPELKWSKEERITNKLVLFEAPCHWWNELTWIRHVVPYSCKTMWSVPDWCIIWK